MKLQTHYVKSRPKREVADLNILGSVIYDLMPSDQLMTKQGIINSVFSYFRDKPVESKQFTKRPNDIGQIIDQLTRQGFLKEIYSTRLQKFVESLP